MCQARCAAATNSQPSAIRMSDVAGWLDVGQIRRQYIFLGGNERRICLRNLATAAAFFRLRAVVGFSYTIRARSSFNRPVLSMERLKRRNATSTGSFGLGITVVNFDPGCDPDGGDECNAERIPRPPLARRINWKSTTACLASFRRERCCLLMRWRRPWRQDCRCSPPRCHTGPGDANMTWNVSRTRFWAILCLGFRRAEMARNFRILI